MMSTRETLAVIAALLLFGGAAIGASPTLSSPQGYRISHSSLTGGGPAASPDGQVVHSQIGGIPDTLLSPSWSLFGGLPMTTPPKLGFQFELQIGWNLVSCPFSAAETVGELFVGAAGFPIKVGALHAWNGTDYELIGDAQLLNALQGAWVYSYWGGVGPSATSVAKPPSEDFADKLDTGWNLVGTDVPTFLPPKDQGYVAAYKWDVGKQHYQQLTAGAILLPGEAYWVYRSN